MTEDKNVRIEIGNRGFTIPGAIASAILVLGTALLFTVVDDPQYATIGSLGLVALAWIAKAWEVNFSDVLTAIGKTEEDLPDSGLPFPANSPSPEGTPGGPALKVDKVEKESKVSAFLFG